MSGCETVMVKKQRSKDVLIAELEDFDIDIYSDYFYVDMYDEDDNFIVRKTELFTVPKYFNWDNQGSALILTKTGKMQS